MRRLTAFTLFALAAAGACNSARDSRAELPNVAARDSGSSQMRYAAVRITRILLYDDHPSAGGRPPDIGTETKRVVLDYERRAPSERPVIRTYTARIAVPSDHPTSWELPLGDDYTLLVVTEGFSRNDDGVTIDGRVKSNYQIQLDPSSMRTGPNANRFWLLPVGESDAVQVLSDEITGRIFREYMEIEVESIATSPPESFTAGIVESADAQKRRWDAWTSVRKSSLR